jgi:hypothetical protein
MLRKIALLLLIAHYGVAFGAAKPEKQVSNSKPSTQASQPDKRGTKESPLIVETRATHSDSETTEEAKKDAEQKRVNGWNIGLTFAIAICAFLQVLAIAGQIVVYLKQTGLMKETLGAIARQGNLMSLQNEMVLSKERGRLYVELEDFTDKEEEFLGFMVRGNISIFGPTDVAIDAADLWAVIDDAKNPSIPPFKLSSIIAPRVIRANSAATPVMTSVMRSEFLEANAEDIEDVFRGKKMIYCRGAIIFTNLFDRKYVFKVSKRYRLIFPGEGLGNDDRMFGRWENYGDPEENGEYPLFEITATQARNPN